MVYRRRRSTRRPARRPRRRAVRRPRNLRTFNPVFTESLPVTALLSDNGGLFQISFNEIPQYATYAALYRKFKILKLTVICMPDQTVGEVLDNGSTPPVYVTSSVGRFVYAINDSATQVPPGSELEVLQDNGCKIIATSKPWKMTCRPQPHVTVGSPTGATPYMDLRNKWMDCATAGTIPHQGIAWYYSNAASPQYLRVYFKVTFSLADPK